MKTKNKTPDPSERDRRGLEQTVEELKGELGYWRNTSESHAPQWVPAADDSFSMSVRSEVDAVDHRLNVAGIASEMLPASKRWEAESRGPSQATIDFIAAELEAQRNTIQYGEDDDGITHQEAVAARTSDRQREVEKVLARRGLPRDFKL